MSTTANVPLAPMTVKGTAECLGGHQGNPPIHDYPHLVLAPFQHGEGVRTADKGIPVEDIAKAFAVKPNPATVAAQFGIEEEAVIQAVNYAAAVGFLASK